MKTKNENNNIKPGPALWHVRHPALKEGEFVSVRVLAVAEGYALARRKGCMVFAVAVKDLIAE